MRADRPEAVNRTKRVDLDCIEEGQSCRSGQRVCVFADTRRERHAERGAGRSWDRGGRWGGKVVHFTAFTKRRPPASLSSNKRHENVLTILPQPISARRSRA